MKTQCKSTNQLVKNLGFLTLSMAFFFFVGTMQALSQERTVTGVVQSLDGPVLGATVMLKGTSQGVSTNENGEFTFPATLNENDVLQVSYLGYENDEVIIKKNTTYVEPFLNDIAIVIYGALRTEKTASIELDRSN